MGLSTRLTADDIDFALPVTRGDYTRLAVGRTVHGVGKRWIVNLARLDRCSAAVQYCTVPSPQRPGLFGFVECSLMSVTPSAWPAVCGICTPHLGRSDQPLRHKDTLILISGFPSSGKTYRSEQFISYCAQQISISSDPKVQRLKVHHISDVSCGLARDVYATARPEKDARATFSSAIKRVLAQDTLVVADGMNYIKGFRYQLYCEAKAMQTPSCVVHIGTTADKCRELNAQNLANGKGAYESEVFENLVFRYEEPNGMTRWDSPLFVVPFEDAQPPCAEIWEAMIGSDGKAKVVRPNAATVLKPASEQGYLYELDKTTSEVIASITQWASDHAGEGGGEVRILGTDHVVEFSINAPSLPHMQRLRRQFIALNRQHSTLSKARIRELFVDYLNDAFNT
nr:protein kti12 [Quercus suber]